MNQNNEILIYNAFPVQYESRELPTGNHNKPSGRYHERLLQHALVYGCNYKILWQKMKALGELPYCSKDTLWLYIDTISSETKPNAKGGKLKAPPCEKLLEQMQIVRAFAEAITSGKAAVKAAQEKTHTGKDGNGIYRTAIELSGYPACKVKAALAAVGVGVKSFLPSEIPSK